MKGTKYILTVRREDVLELYSDQFVFKLFSSENGTRLFYCAFFIIGLIVSLINVFAYHDPWLPTLICTIGLVYNTGQILKKYLKTRTTKKEVNLWIDTFIGKKVHEIEIGEDSFTYYRDSDIFRYDLRKIHKKQFDGRHFILKLTDGHDILLPAKSFEEGKFGEFVDNVDAIILKLRNTQTA